MKDSKSKNLSYLRNNIAEKRRKKEHVKVTASGVVQELNLNQKQKEQNNPC